MSIDIDKLVEEYGNGFLFGDVMPSGTRWYAFGDNCEKCVHLESGDLYDLSMSAYDNYIGVVEGFNYSYFYFDKHGNVTDGPYFYTDDNDEEELEQESPISLVDIILNNTNEYNGHKQLDLNISLPIKQVMSLVEQLSDALDGQICHLELCDDGSGTIYESCHWSIGEHPQGHLSRMLVSIENVEY